MSWQTGLAFYIVIWWVTFFAILPIGNPRVPDDRRPEDPSEERAAPSRPRLILKIIATSLISLALLALTGWVLSNPGLQEYWQ